MHIAVDPVSLRISAPLRQQLLRKFPLANFLTTLFCTIYLSGVGFAQDPASIANLEFWFRSDSGVTIVENKVAAWQSLVNDHVAGNSTVSRRPVLETEVFTEQEGVIFGGGQTGPFLNLNPVTFDSSFTIYSLFKVTDFNNAVQYLFGLSPGVRGFGITNNNQRLIFFDGGLQHEVAEALIEEVYYLIRIEYDATSDELSTDFNFGDIVSEGSINPIAPFGSFVIGSRSDFNWSFHGAFADILFFSGLLNEAEHTEVANYFTEYYAPIPNLPEEIHVSSFCDTTLTIPDRYTSIQWSNGSTEPYTTVSQPGPVSVSVVTIFGDTLQYTTNIIYPGNVIDDFALCFNSDTLWDTGLDDFQVVWQDGSEGPEYTITESGIYFPVVTDVSGCTFAYDTVIVTDDFFSQTLAINYEEPFCQGNALEINQNPEDIVSFNWNTGSSESAIIPDEEGLYWVEVNNENGCTGTDTVTVQFAGIAPEVQYTASQFCAGTEIIFTDETDPGDDSQVVSTIWIFGNDTLQGETVSYSFIEHGNYPLQLRVLTDVGCTGVLTDVIEIHPLPEVAFGHGLPCNNQVTLFEDESTIAEGNLSTWLWDFGNGNTAITPVAAASFPDPGTQEVSLTVTSVEGCAQTNTEIIEVWPSPVAAFDWSQTCEGNMMYLNSLTDTSLTGSVNYAWNLNNVSYAGPAIQHLFSSPGNYTVTHEVWTTINESPGCFDEVTQMVTVSAIPTVQFQTAPACTGEEFMLFSQTEAGANDTIISWHWSTGGTVMDTTASTTWVFDELGSYPVTLAVETQAGCSAEATQNVVVGLSDQPVIAFTPEIGLPPVDVQFTNETSYGQSHFWEFGDGGFSEEESPEYTYQDTGNYIVSLFVFDEAGCSGFASATFQAVEPYFDVAVVEVSSTLVGNQMSASCIIANYNNHRLTTADISISLGNGTVVTEKWSGDLARDQMTSYTFQSQLTVDPEVSEPYTCIEISNPNKNILDAVLSNNRMCKSFSTKSFEVFNPFPNPAVERVEQWFHLERAGTVKIRMVQADGRTLFEQEDNFASGLNKVSISTGRFSAGLYIIELEWNSRVEWRRVLIGK